MSPRARLDPHDDEHWVADPYQSVVAPVLFGWRSIAVGALAGVLLGAIAGFNQPNAFESSAKLLVRTGAREEGTPETRLDVSDRTPTMGWREAVSNEVHLLGDPRVYEAVARDIAPRRILAYYDPAAEDGPGVSLPIRCLHSLQSAWFRLGAAVSNSHMPDECGACLQSATQRLSKDLSVRPEAGSSVLTVKYSTHSPELARDVVDKFVHRALEHHQNVFATDTSLEFLEDQVTEALKDSAQAEKALAENRIQCGIFDIEGRRKSLLEEMAKLESKVKEDGARMVELRSLSGMLGEALAKEPPSLTQLVDRGPITNPGSTYLRQKINELQSQKVTLEGQMDVTPSELAKKRGAIEQQVFGLRAELEALPELIEGGASTQTSANPRYVRLKDREDQVREELTAIESGSHQRVARLGELRRELERIEECEPTMRLLQADADQSRTRVTKLTDARDRLSVINMLDRVKMSNLAVLQEASLPITKAGPRRARLIVIGALLGCGAGILMLFMRRGFERCVREPRDLFALNPDAVVCAVPRARPGWMRSLWPTRRAAL